MGDWCVPNSPTPTDCKQGRVNQSHIPRGFEKGNKKNSHRNVCSLLTCLPMGDLIVWASDGTEFGCEWTTRCLGSGDRRGICVSAVGRARLGVSSANPP